MLPNGEKEKDKDCGPCKYSALIKKTCGELAVDLRNACKKDIVDATVGNISDTELSQRLKERGVEKKFAEAVDELF